MPKFYFRITSHNGFFQDTLGEDHDDGMKAIEMGKRVAAELAQDRGDWGATVGVYSEQQALLAEFQAGMAKPAGTPEELSSARM